MSLVSALNRRVGKYWCLWGDTSMSMQDFLKFLDAQISPSATQDGGGCQHAARLSGPPLHIATTTATHSTPATTACSYHHSNTHSTSHQCVGRSNHREEGRFAHDCGDAPAHAPHVSPVCARCAMQFDTQVAHPPLQGGCDGVSGECRPCGVHPRGPVRLARSGWSLS